MIRLDKEYKVYKPYGGTSSKGNTYYKATIRDSKKDDKTGEWKSEFYKIMCFGGLADYGETISIEKITGVEKQSREVNGQVYEDIVIFCELKQDKKPQQQSEFAEADDGSELPF
jgi:hypothetical protein